MLTLEHGLLEKLQSPLPSPTAVRGLADTLTQVSAELKAAPRRTPTETEDLSRATAQLSELSALLTLPPRDLAEWTTRLVHMEQPLAKLTVSIQHLAGAASPSATAAPGLSGWVARLADEVRRLREEAAGLAPWLGPFPPRTPGGRTGRSCAAG